MSDDNDDDGNGKNDGFSAQSFRLHLVKEPPAVAKGQRRPDPALVRRLSRLAAEAAEGNISGFAMVSIHQDGGVRLSWNGTGSRELQIVGALKALENVILQSVKVSKEEP